MNEELNLEEFNFNACYIENRLVIFENQNYMNISEAEMLYEWLGKLIRKEKNMKPAVKKGKKVIAVTPKPKKTTKKK